MTQTDLDNTAPAPAEPAASALTHAEFVAAYTSGRLKVNIVPKEAARFLSRRMMLPWILLPVFGIAVAIALVGHWIIGCLIFAAGLGLRWLSRATAPGYIMQRALADRVFYDEVQALGFLLVEGN